MLWRVCRLTLLLIVDTVFIIDISSYLHCYQGEPMAKGISQILLKCRMLIQYLTPNLTRLQILRVSGLLESHTIKT